MALQGLDRAAAPPPQKAKQMLDAIGGGWWNVYIGGPESGGSGWTPSVVKSYAQQGIRKFMLTYVGRQWDGPLTRKQGRADAQDALALATSFGYSGAYPLCLDVELKTYNTSPQGAVKYAAAWCDAVRAAGARPGVYANPDPLKGMSGKVAADFVWVASWVGHGAGQREPRDAPGLSESLWGRPGQRAWQYGAEYGGKKCRVLGLDVDINVADPGCLAGPPGKQKTLNGRPPKWPGRALRRGVWGDDVEMWQEKMIERGWHLKPSGRFDAASQQVCSDFQKEKQLEITGHVDRKTWAATWRTPVTP